MYLNCKTWFSYRYGTFTTEALVKEAAMLGVHTLALTNINNTSDIWDFVKFCGEYVVKPVVGAEIRNGDTLEYILLARNNNGLLQINRFMSEHLHRQMNFPARPALVHDVWIIYPLGNIDPLNLLAHEKIGVQPG